MTIKEKIEEMLREADNYPEDDIYDEISFQTTEDNRNEVTAFIIGFEKALELVLNLYEKDYYERN